MNHKELTIREIFAELKTLYAKLIILAEKYNRSLITITAVSWKDIMTQGGKKGDIMLNKTIKKESLTNEFDIVKASYDSCKEEAIDKLRDMINKNSVGYCIAYLRDSLSWKWSDISKLFNYSRIQCIRLYKKEKMLQDDTQ